MLNREFSYSLALAAVILGAAAAVRYAESLGLDAEGGRRTQQVVIGLALAVYANFMPKRRGRSQATRGAARASQPCAWAGGRDVARRPGSCRSVDARPDCGRRYRLHRRGHGRNPDHVRL